MPAVGRQTSSKRDESCSRGSRRRRNRGYSHDRQQKGPGKSHGCRDPREIDDQQMDRPAQREANDLYKSIFTYRETCIFGALCPSKSGLMNKHIVKTYRANIHSPHISYPFFVSMFLTLFSLEPHRQGRCLVVGFNNKRQNDVCQSQTEVSVCSRYTAVSPHAPHPQRSRPRHRHMPRRTARRSSNNNNTPVPYFHSWAAGVSPSVVPEPAGAPAPDASSSSPPSAGAAAAPAPPPGAVLAQA